MYIYRNLCQEWLQHRGSLPGDPPAGAEEAALPAGRGGEGEKEEEEMQSYVNKIYYIYKQKLIANHEINIFMTIPASR